MTWLKQSFPGVSRETWLLKADMSGHEQGFVLRVDLEEGSSFPKTLELEYEVYRRLFPSEVPVAEPLWFAANIDIAEGRPHMVRRLVDGSSVIPGLSDPGDAGDALRRKIAYECIENLARVHMTGGRTASARSCPCRTVPATRWPRIPVVARLLGSRKAEPRAGDRRSALLDGRNIPDTPRISMVSATTASAKRSSATDGLWP
ncbi:MAG: hypothetical protein QHC40_01100 [Sphingobium sp.]|nr:hypothetical protein [Sphingobium sp.]